MKSAKPKKKLKKPPKFTERDWSRSAIKDCCSTLNLVISKAEIIKKSEIGAVVFARDYLRDLLDNWTANTLSLEKRMN